MGGHALSLPSIRLPAASYHALEASVLARLKAAYPEKRIEAIFAYAEKRDFGDMDILIDDADGYDARAVAALLGACEVVENGDVTSIGVRLPEGVFQIDLLQTPTACFDFAARYFGFNDLGNLLGRVARRFGAKLGQRGLLYPLRDPDNGFHLLAELTITLDFACALRLLGYDPVRYESLRSGGGFRTLDDIFAYVVSSPYVHPDLYLLENLNHRARVRDAKRPTYHAFLAWLARQAPGSVPAWPWAAKGTPELAAQQQAFLATACAASPQFERDYAKAMAAWQRKQQIRQRYNGKLAGQITGLSGPPLGQLMQAVRQHFADEAALEAFFFTADAAALVSLYRQLAAPIVASHNADPVPQAAPSQTDKTL